MQRKTFNTIGNRPPIHKLEKNIVRERLGTLGFLDPAAIFKADKTVKIYVEKNIYNISSNLEFKTIKTFVDNDKVVIPSENYGIQEIMVNLEEDNLNPAFGQIDDFVVDGQVVSLGTDSYGGRLAYVKYLTIKSEV